MNYKSKSMEIHMVRYFNKNLGTGWMPGEVSASGCKAGMHVIY